MLVFLDIQAAKVKIYTDQGIQSLSFLNIEAIKQIIGDQKVLYVTNAIETDADHITQIVKQVASNLTTSPGQKEEPAYLRTTLKGYLSISEMGLTFEGPIHFHPLKRLYDEYGKDVFTKYKVLGRMLKSGKLQIVTKSQANTLRKENLVEQKAKQHIQDAALDSIIVQNEKVDSYMDDMDGSDNGLSGHSDIVEIEVKGIGSGSPATSNEGSLLPDDFVGGGTGASSNEGSLLPDDFEG